MGPHRAEDGVFVNSLFRKTLGQVVVYLYTCIYICIYIYVYVYRGPYRAEDGVLVNSLFRKTLGQVVCARPVGGSVHREIDIDGGGGDFYCEEGHRGVKRSTGHAHTHTDREQHPRHRHTRTQQEQHPKPPNEHIPQTLNNARRCEELPPSST